MNSKSQSLLINSIKQGAGSENAVNRVRVHPLCRKLQILGLQMQFTHSFNTHFLQNTFICIPRNYCTASHSIYESHPRPKTSYSSVSVATPKGICSLTPSPSELRSRLTLLLTQYLQFVKMTARTVLPGDSHSQRALVQPALPIVLIKQGTGRGTFESSLDQP